MEGMVSQHEAQEIIRDLQVTDRMQFTQSTLHAILTEKSPCQPALAISQRQTTRYRK
jgi:hypothetical protein